MIARTAPAAAPARAFIAVSFTCFVARDIRLVPFTLIALRRLALAFGFPAALRFFVVGISILLSLGASTIGAPASRALPLVAPSQHRTVDGTS
jgi:hypothetical protein